MKNLKLGALQHARGSQAKTQPGWASLGEDMQTRMLKCPCGRGALPRPQDAVHFIEECSYTQPMREEVFKSMGAVVDREGHPQDKQMWAGLTDQGRLDHSLNSAKLFTRGVDSKAKSAGALAWAKGLQQAEGEMEKHNIIGSLTWVGAVQREVVCQEIGRAVDWDNHGAEEDLGNLVAGLVQLPGDL